jgi:hypothetical protein
MSLAAPGPAVSALDGYRRKFSLRPRTAAFVGVIRQHFGLAPFGPAPLDLARDRQDRPAQGSDEPSIAIQRGNSRVDSSRQWRYSMGLVGVPLVATPELSRVLW